MQILESTPVSPDGMGMGRAQFSPRDLMLQSRASSLALAKARGSGSGNGAGGELGEASSLAQQLLGNGVPLRAMPPRERAHLLRLELERRRRWKALVVLAARSSHWLDELVWQRNNRHLAEEQQRAASLIQRKHTSKQLRRSLEKLSGSMGCLRKNVAIFAFRWRVRNKVRSGDTLRAFLADVREKSRMRKAVHNFVYHAVKLQRAWRRYASIIRAQLGLLTVQFDRLLSTKKTPDLFLSEAEKRLYMKQASTAMLAKAETQTNAGRRQARRAAAEAAEAAADVAAEGGTEETSPTAAAPAASAVLLIDLDCKARVISGRLRQRRVDHWNALMDYHAELARVDNLVKKQQQMEEARRVARGETEEEGTAAVDDVGASEGITDLAAQVGDFANMVAASPPPRVKLLLSQEDVQSLIAQALLATADRMHAGLPVDANRSLSASGNKSAA